jgi:hypothetical protein
MKEQELNIKQEMYNDLKNNNNVLLGVNIFLFLYLLSRSV